MGWRRLEISDKEAAEISAVLRKKARFLIDENLGPEAAGVISSLGWNARFAGDVGLSGHSDEDVAAYCWREQRILLTHDQDFLDDSRFPPHRNYGVIVLPGGDGDVATLEKALAKVLSVVGNYERAFSGCKMHVHKNGNWSIRFANSPRGSKGAQIIKFDGRGDAWEFAEPEHPKK